MSEMRYVFLRKVIIGFAVGLLIGAAIMVVWQALGYPQDTAGTGEIIRALVCCGLYGSACIGGMLLYRCERVSLLCATLLHLLIVMVGLFLLGLALGWQYDQGQVWYLFVAYAIVFFINWSVMYLIGRRRAHRLNGYLRQCKAQGHTDTAATPKLVMVSSVRPVDGENGGTP